MNNRTQSINQQGFSIIELVIVISIIAILSAIAIPMYGGFLANRNLKSAARDIAGDVFEMKARAIAEDRMYQITFDQGANSYVMRQCNDTALPCNGTDIGTKSPRAFQDGIAINALNLTGVGGTVVQLQSRGIVNPPGTGTVTLINGRGSTATITVSLTGRASVDWTGTLH